MFSPTVWWWHNRRHSQGGTMGQVLHGSATTTHAIRAAIQRSKASIQALSGRYGINRKTVTKWRKRTSLEDHPMGPKAPHSTVLSAAARVERQSVLRSPVQNAQGLSPVSGTVWIAR